MEESEKIVLFNQKFASWEEALEAFILFRKGDLYLKSTGGMMGLSAPIPSVPKDVEEKKHILLFGAGKHILLIGFYLAGFSLSTVTGSLLEAVKNKNPEIVTTF